MRVEDFDFVLPEHLIAQTPLAQRSSSKLMIVNKTNQTIAHDVFSHLIDYLRAGDCLVLNDSKVIPARLHGVKDQTGGHVELLLLKETQVNHWEALVKPAKRVKIGTRIVFGAGELIAECTQVLADGGREFKMVYEGIFYEVLDQLGTMPLPPYITEQLEDRDRYQTVYAKHQGSAAAPTAGLHFTPELLTALQAKGVQIVTVTLHVGLGTFRPVAVDTIDEHTMHSEYYEMSAETATILNEAKANKRRIITVGTTSTRTLESIMNLYGTFKACSGWTDIFIYPGYTFKAIDGLVTNFHLPKSTLIMLISAFANQQLIMDAYYEAIENEYRFFSFGDSMFIY
ncbi:MAG: tRNA preQ1(34) S-adenosylmethionine ribosyltransferase-isomerase QueA [Culicoidibacterales bacterium]